MTEQRRLAAILVADVVGYSKLIGSNEAGTLAQLQALRTEVIEPQIAKHAGRLFKAVGDGFLIEFASAVQAVSRAKAIQEASDQGRLSLRIGIHVGDVASEAARRGGPPGGGAGAMLSTSVVTVWSCVDASTWTLASTSTLCP